jgi:hypothetical protein
MKSFYQKYKSLLPVILLTFFCIPLIISIYTGKFTFNNEEFIFHPGLKHYFALAAVILCYSSFFFYRAYFKYILLLTIIIGLFSAIQFTTYLSTNTFTTSFITLRFQPAAFYAGLLAYILLFRETNEFFIGLTKTTSVETARESNEKREEK